MTGSNDYTIMFFCLKNQETRENLPGILAVVKVVFHEIKSFNFWVLLVVLIDDNY